MWNVKNSLLHIEHSLDILYYDIIFSTSHSSYYCNVK